MAVRPLTNTSSTELSRHARMRSSSVSSVPLAGSRVVKSVWGATSGVLFMSVQLSAEGKDGLSMMKVSLVGVKRRVVVCEKSFCFC